MALRSTQPLTEMSKMFTFWCSRPPVRKADNLANFMHRHSRNPEASTSWNLQACTGIAFSFGVFLNRNELHKDDSLKLNEAQYLQTAVSTEVCM